ncbi:MULTISPECIES: TonB-dependent receptor [unclassified Spirosoma]|uniref:TonB-dependent receptor n=1 Tax=unclassified Spirosoma TaxID=2621999 RepID=UPI00096502AB|nr:MULTISPECIES: TonB-dependent receptor [unclassified Spirosoma]MBN8822199.1 TonB-dependent receptor [Spirosoma sp.]OJW72482.1 MAG: energy transducer TonB [Spirosoma sp. 48-14]
MKACFLLLLLGFTEGLLYAQPTPTRQIRGSVTDADNHKPIPFGTITLIGQNKGAITDARGQFSLSIKADTLAHDLVISCVGYKSDTITVTPGTDMYTATLLSVVNSLNEVVVTGVTRGTLLRQNPVAILAISHRAIEGTASSNIIDVLVKNAPGLNAVKTGPNISKPFIRGLGYNRVLTLYDGVRQEGQQWGDEHGIEVDNYNIERAEVIKGPASLMYGSDALAGVVSMMPVYPKDTEGKLKVGFVTEYQSNNRLLGESISLASGGSRWAWNFRGSIRAATNYQNKIDGRVYNTGFSERTLTTMVGYTGHQGYSRFGASLYDNLQGIPDGSRDSLTRQFTKQIFEPDQDDIQRRPIVPASELTSYHLSPLHQHIQHYRLHTNNHYQVGNGEIDALLAFQQNVRREYSHPTQVDQPSLYVRLNTINYGLRYNLPNMGQLATTLGVNGMYQANKNKNGTAFPIPDYHLFDFGTFVFLKWQADKLTLSGGLRYDNRRLTGDDFYVRNNPRTGFDEHVSLPDTTGATLQYPQLKQSFTGISASLGLTYEFSDKVALKANIARGYRAPSITEIASNGLDPGAHIVYIGNRNFQPEFSIQEDIGLTATYPDVNFGVSVFNNFILNYISLAQLVDDKGEPVVIVPGNKTFQYQQSSAQLYGFETQFSLHPTTWKGFTFDNTIAVVYGYNRGSRYTDAGVQGEYLPFIPPLRISTGFSQQLPIKRGWLSDVTVKADVDYNARQDRYLGLNDTETPTDGYTLVNLGLDSQIHIGRDRPALRFLFQINNLFDTAYQSNLSRLKYFEYFTQSPNGRLGMYGMGRNICLKLTIPFN